MEDPCVNTGEKGRPRAKKCCMWIAVFFFGALAGGFFGGWWTHKNVERINTL